MDVHKTPHIYTKRGIYYFSRRIPQDLKCHYKHDRISISLRTRSHKIARSRAASLAVTLDEGWLTLRWRSSSDPFSRFLADRTVSDARASHAPTLSEAKDIYLKAKGKGRSITFEQAAERSVGYLMALHGDRPIDTYTRSDVNDLRDALSERGLKPSSVRRVFNTLRALVNFVSREQGLPDVRSFSGVYLGEDVTGSEAKRKPIPVDVIKTIQAECMQLDDEARWLIAMISDTGIRLSEAVGLVADDVNTDGKAPHIALKAHPWRRLKTKGSERIVPLVGASLWAAERALSGTSGQFVFPRYCSEEGCKANSASAALNKWLNPRVPDGCVVHSFRHSMRDRLRTVECPPDVIDRIGGWTVGGVGEGYGSGYPLKVLRKWMAKIV